MVFTLAVNFMMGLGIFGDIESEYGHETGDNTNDTMSNFTKTPEYTSGFDMTTIWGLVFAAEIAGGIAIATLLQDATILGIYIFSTAFWTSFINAWAILGSTGFIPIAFLGLFTVPIFFIFIGAVIGMLSGV